MLIPFSPPPGLSSDDTSFKAQGRWKDGRQVRFVDGSPQLIGHYTALFSGLGGAIYNMFTWDRGGTSHIAYARASAIYVGSGISAPTARTPTGLGSHTAYAFAGWGDTLLFAPSGGTLYDQSGSSNAAAVTNAPDVITWMLVTPQRQVLAFGCNEEGSGTFNALCIRGSDLEDYTDWTTSATNNAFEHILEGSGKIVTARQIGEQVAVWTDNGLYVGRFIGDPGQTYRFDPVARRCGAVGPNAVAIVQGRAYWLGHDLLLRTWTPGSLVETVPCPIHRAMVEDINPSQVDLATVAHVTRYEELWIHWTSGGNGGSFNVSLRDLTWWRSDIERFSVLCDDTLAPLLANTYGITNVIAADINGIVYVHECVDSSNVDGPTEWSLESSDFYMDESEHRMMIRGIIHDGNIINAQNEFSCTLRILASDYPGSTETTSGPFMISTVDRKKDFRVSGQIFRVSLSEFSSGALAYSGDMRLGKLLFDIVPLGLR